MVFRGFNVSSFTGHASRAALVAAVGLALAGCEERRGNAGSYRAFQAIPSDALALMQQKGTDAHKPILIRAFKKEAEFEIWKMRADGEYVHFKTYPMCRWSGQLGPKRREGDRQVPEGFYTITQGQLNPNSAYYLSFNVGYPNAYDKAHGYTGGAIMVHGDCSSAGCFSMTDDQIAEIYAIAREAFGGGQRAIQMQSLPFRMTPENLAKHRFDPNIRFWKQLKEGVDQFEVSKRETKVAICNQRYVFGATPVDASARLDANAQCPVMNEDSQIKTAVAAKQRNDDAKVAELVAGGVKAVKIVYADGGQHPSFANSVTMLSRPEAVASGPTEIQINEQGKPVPAVVQVAAAKAEAARPAAPANSGATTGNPGKPSLEALLERTGAVPPPGKTSVAKAAAPAPTENAASFVATAAPVAAATPEQPFYKRWLGFGGSESAPAASVQPASVPVPPRRQAQTPAKPQASLAKPKTAGTVAGAQPAVPTSLAAYSPASR